MPEKLYNILVLGASYGALPAIRCALAGHRATLVCTQGTAELINTEGMTVRLPVRGRDHHAEVKSLSLPGAIRAATPTAALSCVEEFDLAILAMQEPQYHLPGVRDLLQKLATAQLPCLSIMNMPPPPFLQRIDGVDVQSLAPCYTAPDIWQDFSADKVTLASPDPQAFRPPDEPKNVLQVALPTNFKAAKFGHEADTVMLRNLEADILASRFDMGGGDLVELPVKLRVHDSLYVPLAKWAMLITGNYRCVQLGRPRSIRDAVHTDINLSRAVYENVVALCTTIGASPDDMVPFEKYAKAAESLIKPSSVARAIDAGAKAVERVDMVVLILSKHFGVEIPELETTVATVNAELAKNS